MIFPAGKGFRKAQQNIAGKRKRMLNPSEGLKAIGREVVKGCMRNFRKHKGSQTMRGGGPPGAPWPGLEKKTAFYKEKRGKNVKLEDKKHLGNRFEYKIEGKNSVIIYNTEYEKIEFLQKRGVGKKKKKFIIVPTKLKKQDKPLWERCKKINSEYIFRGKKAAV